MERSKAESFTAYLEAKQRDRNARGAHPSQSAGTAFSVLAALAANPQLRMGLADLQHAAGMSFFDYSQALKRLQDSGHLTVSGDPGLEVAHLTQLGWDVTALAR